MTDNYSGYTSEYDTIFAGNLGAHVGIGLGNGAVGTPLTGCLIEGNTCIDPKGNAGIAMIGGSGNTIGVNNLSQAGEMFIADAVVGVNTIKQHFVKSFTPNVFATTGTIVVDTANSPCRYANDGKRVLLDMTVKLSSVTGASGTLSIGPIPGVAGKNAAISNLQVSFWDNLISATIPLAMADVSNPARIVIFRSDGGRVLFDMGANVQANSAIRVCGEIVYF